MELIEAGSTDYIEPMYNPVMTAFNQNPGTTETKQCFLANKLLKSVLKSRTEDIHIDAIKQMTESMR